MKGKKLLLGALTLAMLCTAGGGTILMANAAEGVTFGNFITYDNASGTYLNGTKDGKSEITTSGGWGRTLQYVTGVDKETMSIEVSLTPDADIALQLSVFPYEVGADDLGHVQQDLTANTETTVTYKLSETQLTENQCCIAFYFDTANAGTVKHVVINSFKVGGVDYTPAPYVEPDPEVPAPDKAFKAYTEWKVTGGTAEACTLEKLPASDPKFEGAIDDGVGKVTFTSTENASIEIPLSQDFTAWPTAWTNLYTKFKAENITQINVYYESVAVEAGRTDEPDDNHGAVLGIMSAWNVTVVNSVSEGFKLSKASVAVNDFLKGHDITSPDDWVTVIGHADGHEKLTKLVFVPVFKEGATSGTIEFGGMAFGGAEAPVFINDIGVPQLEIGKWENQDSAYTITPDGELEVGEGEEAVTYKGLKISYTKDGAGAAANAYATVSNFDKARYPKLHLGFYADQAFKLAVYGDWSDCYLWHTEFTAGYHEIDLDFSAATVSATFTLRFFIDGQEDMNFEGTKTVVFDSIVFYKDVENLPDEATAPNGFFSPKYENNKLTWTYDAKDAGGYYYVAVPVENWNSFNRYLHINVTLSHEMAFGVWGSGNAFLDNYHQNSTHPVYGAGTYDLWLGVSTTNFKQDATNYIELYCDVNNGAAATLTKTVTVNSIEFVSEAPKTSSPNTNKITVDYAARTVSFEDIYEVATAADFAEGTTLTSGAAITPGATLYLRAKDGSSAVSSVTYAAVALAKEDIAAPTVGSNYIRFGGTGYEYRFGDSTEWVDLGSWGNLDAETEYTVHIRIKATATSFASEEVEYKVTTLKEGESQTPGGTTPGGDAPGGTTPGGTTDPAQGCGGCGSSVIGYGSLGVVACVAIALGCVLFIRRKHNN